MVLVVWAVARVEAVARVALAVALVTFGFSCLVWADDKDGTSPQCRYTVTCPLSLDIPHVAIT